MKKKLHRWETLPVAKIGKETQETKAAAGALFGEFVAAGSIRKADEVEMSGGKRKFGNVGTNAGACSAIDCRVPRHLAKTNSPTFPNLLNASLSAVFRFMLKLN